MTEIAMETQQPDKMNPWLSIWAKPKKTIRHVIEQRPGSIVMILAMLFGVSNVLDRAYMMNLGETTSIGGIVLASLIIGPIAGLVMWYLSSAIIQFTGKKLGGQGTMPEVRRALAYSYIPIVCTLVLWIPDYAIQGEYLFTEDGSPLIGLGGWGLYLFSGIVESVLAVWAIIITVAAVSEVHRFSIGKSILTLLIPAIIFIVAIILLVVVVLAIA